MKEKRELMLFIMNEEESVEEEDRTEESPEEVVKLKQLNQTDGIKVELKTISGLTNKGTMKIKGYKREGSGGTNRQWSHPQLYTPQDSRDKNYTVGGGNSIQSNYWEWCEVQRKRSV